MNVLVGFEISGRVRDAFKLRGHNAISCDIKDTEVAGKHIKDDIRNLFNSRFCITFFNLAILFPPCTHLAVSGAKHFKEKKEDGSQREGIELFMNCVEAKFKKKSIENPVGIMSTLYRKPDQIIQPYYFGDKAQKTTCLWLFNLPPLFHAKEVDLFNEKITHVGKGEFVVTPSGKRLPKWYSDNKNPDARSKTFQGIAQAMAEQWG